MGKQQQADHHFEQQYIGLRDKEQRLYSLEQVARLPEIDKGHPHYREWQVRKRSVNRLLTHLAEQQRPLDILESGCGNGWLSAKMAGVKNVTVTGIDVNDTELEQARQVFGNHANLSFIRGDIRDASFDAQRFDCIVFAASVQYFPSLSDIVKRALSLLNPGGELLLVDTNFYLSPAAAAAAKERTHQYYTRLGFPDMSRYYFHHQLSELRDFHFKLLYDPRRMVNRLLHRDDRFFWVQITA